MEIHQPHNGTVAIKVDSKSSKREKLSKPFFSLWMRPRSVVMSDEEGESASKDQYLSTDDEADLIKDNYVSVDEDDIEDRSWSTQPIQRCVDSQSGAIVQVGGKIEESIATGAMSDVDSSKEKHIPQNQDHVEKSILPNEKKSNRTLCYIGFAFLLTVVAVGVVVPIFCIRKDNDGVADVNKSLKAVPVSSSSSVQPSSSPSTKTSTQPSTTPSTQPSTIPSTQPSTIPSQAPSERSASTQTEALFTLLDPLSSDGGAALRDSSTSQNAALLWLKSNDLLFVYSDQRKVQRYALAVLYYALGGDQWRNNTGWLVDLDECFWLNSAESSCDSNGTLISLRLFENNVVGSIPPEMGLLTSLKVLELHENTIVGSIPKELYTLSKLQILNLASNRLTGSLSSEIESLDDLTYLGLYSNTLQGTIPSEIGQISRLGVIDIGFNNLTGALPASVGLLTSLSVLALQDNSLGGSLPSEMARLTSLIVVYLDNLDISGPFPEEICDLKFVAQFYSDCDEIGCTCCTNCCIDNLGCT